MDRWSEEMHASTATLILVYALWFLTVLAALGACILGYGALTRLYVALQFNKYGLTAYTYAVITVLMLAWLVLVIASEGIYRRAAERGTLARRTAWILGTLVILNLLGLLIGRLG